MPRASVTFPLAFPVARPRALTGEVELRLAAAARIGSRPQRVTAFLADSYEAVADEEAGLALMRSLSTGTREALLQSAALRFHPGLEWFQTRCASCGESFDVTVALGDAPRKTEGPGFPVTQIDTSLGTRRFEAPNGGHEESVARRMASEPGLDVRRAFAALCGLGENAQEDAAGFDESDLTAIDDAMEALSPEIADETHSRCPACGADAVARIDPFRFALPREAEILQSVHRLARAYGWREDEILRLSTARRRSYDAFVAADDRQGLTLLQRWRS